MRILKKIFYSACIVFFPLLLALAYIAPNDGGFFPTNYPFVLLVYSLVALPPYFAVIATVRFIFSVTQKEKPPLWERIVNGALLLPATACFVSLFKFSELVPLALWSAIAILAVWSVCYVLKCILYKRPPAIFSWVVGLLKSKAPFPRADILSPLFFIITFSVSAVLSIGIISANYAIENLNAPNNDYDFICSIEPRDSKYFRGESGKLTIGTLNRSGDVYVYTGNYSDFRPTVRLIHSQTGYEISFDEIPTTNDYGTYKLYDSEYRIVDFTFTIPEDAPYGEYDAHVSFKDYSNVFEDAIAVTDGNFFYPQLKTNEVAKITVTSLPQSKDYEKTFTTNGKINELITFINSIPLSSDFSEDPSKYGGQTVCITISYNDGTTVKINVFAGMFISIDESGWVRADKTFCTELETLIFSSP